MSIKEKIKALKGTKNDKVFKKLLAEILGELIEEVDAVKKIKVIVNEKEPEEIKVKSKSTVKK